MSFFRFIIGIPLIVAVATVALMNNHKVQINPWPLKGNGINPDETEALLTLVIIACFAFGYLFGRIDSWMVYSPLRSALRSQRRQNKKLNAAQQKLTEKVEGLQENLENMKSSDSVTAQDFKKISILNGIKDKISSLFKPKPKKEEDFWCL